MEKFEQTAKLSYFDVDALNQIKLSVLIDLLLKVSSYQLDTMGVGTNNLARENLGWVVTQYHMEIKRLPQLDEEIILGTQPTGYNRFFCYRDFWVKTQEGESLITVSSTWIVLDLLKREIHENTSEFGAKMAVPEVKRGPRLPRIRLPKFDDSGVEYRVRYYDIDANRHVNNSHYFEWMIDVLPQDLVLHAQIKCIDIKFDQEIRYGDSPRSLVKVEEQEELKSYHLIQNGTGKASEAIFTWKK